MWKQDGNTMLYSDGDSIWRLHPTGMIRDTPVTIVLCRYLTSEERLNGSINWPLMFPTMVT